VTSALHLIRRARESSIDGRVLCKACVSIQCDARPLPFFPLAASEELFNPALRRHPGERASARCGKNPARRGGPIFGGGSRGDRASNGDEMQFRQLKNWRGLNMLRTLTFLLSLSMTQCTPR